MGRRPVLHGATVVAVIASLVIGPSATATSERQSAGTVVIGHDQEPAILNGLLTAGTTVATGLVVFPVLAGGAIYDERAVLVPYLLDGLPKVVRQSPLTVKFAYKKSARWSDGKPVTGADFVATWRTIMNPEWHIAARTGFEDVESVEATGKSVVMVFKKGKPFFGWESMSAYPPLPAHRIAGVDFNKLWIDSLDIASGPFKFLSWQRGTQLTLVRNPTYAAGPRAKLDRIVFRFIPSTPSLFQALSSGEIDVMAPQPQLQIADIRRDSRFRIQSGTGYYWEHLDIQLGPKGHPALKQTYVRQALITGINRAQIRQALYITPGLVASAKDLPVLQSHVFMPFERYYRPNFARYEFSQRNAIVLLRKHGCTGGPGTPAANNSAIWSCPGVGKLSFRFVTTSGNQLRALTFEIAQKQLKSVGIELLPRFGPAAQVLTQVLPSGDWDLLLFTWLGGPSFSGAAFGLYGCGGDQNYMSYCDRRASALFKRAAYVPDAERRAALLNRAEAMMADDVPSIPMFVKPSFLIHNRRVTGPKLNPTLQGPTWNVEAWALAS